MEIFLTGGTGFIGSYVVDTLLKKGHHITILARNPGKVSAFINHPDIGFLKGTLKSHSEIESVLGDYDACIHIALGWGDTPESMLIEDTMQSVFLFQCAAQKGIKHFIYTSSVAAIGEFRPEMREDIDTRPCDYYGATKASSESYLLAISKQTGMRSVIIRPGYTFGNPVVTGAPMQPDTRFRDIVSNALHNREIKLTRNDGTQFIWAGDLAKLYDAALNSTQSRQIYHGLGQEYVTWDEIAGMALTFTGSSSKITLEDKGYSDKPFLFNMSKIENEFGLKFGCREKIGEHLKYIQRVIPD